MRSRRPGSLRLRRARSCHRPRISPPRAHLPYQRSPRSPKRAQPLGRTALKTLALTRTTAVPLRVDGATCSKSLRPASGSAAPAWRGTTTSSRSAHRVKQKNLGLSRHQQYSRPRKRLTAARALVQVGSVSGLPPRRLQLTSLEMELAQSNLKALTQSRLL